MAEETHRDILRRILGDSPVALRTGAPAHGANGVAALRLEAARATRDMFGLTAIVEACDALRPSLSELEREFAPGTLAVLLNGPDDRLGLAVFTPELALALLEWRLLGLLGEQAPPARPLTATDAAILADLTDPLLARFGAAMAGSEAGAWATGFAQGAHLEDPRHIPLTLSDVPYHGFRLRLALGEGARGGALFLALPEPAQTTQAAAPEMPGRPWPEALKAGVLGAELALTAVLWRTRMPAAAVGRLRPGDLLPLPATALNAVRLEGPGGVSVAEGRLGRAHGDRAVKIEGGTPGEANAEEVGLAPPPPIPVAADDPVMPAAAPLAAPVDDGDPMAEMDFPMQPMGDLPAMP